MAIIVIVLVSSISDWRKEKQFQLLNEKREDRTVTAIRGGRQVNINTKVRLKIWDMGSSKSETKSPHFPHG